MVIDEKTVILNDTKWLKFVRHSADAFDAIAFDGSKKLAHILMETHHCFLTSLF